MPTNLMHRRNRVLRDFRREHRGEQVHAERSGERIELTATRARSEHDRIEDDGLVTRFITLDWIVPAEDYVFGGEPVEPQAGDRIIAVEAGDRATYEVVAVSGGNGWDWLNKAHQDLRIYTKRIATRG